MSNTCKVISKSRNGKHAEVVIHSRDITGVLRSTTHHVALRSGVAEVVKTSELGHEVVTEAYDVDT